MKTQEQKRKEEIIGNLKFELTEEEISLKEKYTKEVISKKEKYKVLGRKLIKNGLIEKWNSKVNNFFRTRDSIWYNGVILEATLECMRKLSNGCSLEEAYKTIDVQNLEMPPIIMEMKLTGYQNYLVAELVGEFHQRGKEFCEYRSAFIKNPHYRNQNPISLKLKNKPKK